MGSTPTPTVATTTNDAVKVAANHIAATKHADVLFYNGPITRHYDRRVIGLCGGTRKRETVFLILVTEGGDPDAAYRFSRALQNGYRQFTCLISGYCKSAGTIVATGAHTLVFSQHGEMGPIDVQMSKKDELWEFESGLTQMASLTTLHERALAAFEHFFTAIKIRSGGNISLKMATQLAADLTTGLFSPIYAQIDPLHVGEAGRAMSIATEYIRRLDQVSNNLKPEALEKLVSEYPSHGFVIDKKEAEGLFSHVRDTDDDENALLAAMGSRSYVPISSDRPWIAFLSDEREEITNDAATRVEHPVTPQGGANGEATGTDIEGIIAPSGGSISSSVGPAN